MTILHVNTTDRGGGAEKIACNLFQADRKQGHNSYLAVGYKKSHDPNIVNVFSIPWGKFENRVLQGVRRRFFKYEGNIRKAWKISCLWKRITNPRKEQNLQRSGGKNTYFSSNGCLLLNLTPQKPDIIHCHNLHGGYFDLQVLPWLSHQVPLVLTLHDAWLLSGHCAHSLECERWKTGCGNCPDQTTHKVIRQDVTACNWNRKRNIYAKSRFYIATPSKWLMKKVNESILMAGAVECRIIPHGVDLSIFRTADKQSVRMALGIPLDAKMLLFTANGIRKNRYKDYQTLRKTINLIANKLVGEKIFFVGLGENAPSKQIGQTIIRFVRYEKDPKTVAKYYQAADVYVHAVRAETWGLTITEALACGTPVVATNVGGIPEQIDDGKDGILVPAGDSEGMASAVNRLLRDSGLRSAIGEQGILKAREKFSLERQAKEFLAWYQEIIEDWKGRKLRKSRFLKMRLENE